MYPTRFDPTHPFADEEFSYNRSNFRKLPLLWDNPVRNFKFRVQY